MNVELLIQSVMGLVVILAILVYVLFYSNKKEEIKPVVKKKEKVDVLSLEHLHSIIKNKQSSTEELQKALKQVIKYHGTIHPKLGTRTHPDYDIYRDIMVKVCTHPSTNKDIILKFDRELEARNPNYSIEINKALSQGLNSRV